MKRRSTHIVAGAIASLALGVILFQNSSVSFPPSGDNTSLGKSIYDARCTMCHGTDGKGSGLAAAFIEPTPRDFTTGKFKFRSTESGSIPADADIERTIREGLHSTTMPDWKDFLSGDSLRAVVAYIKSFSPRFQQEQPHPVKLGSAVPSSPASIAAGKKVYDRLQCASCHGSDGTAKDAVAMDLKDDSGNNIAATNLTEPWTFRAGSSAQDIYLRFRTGIDGTPMPSFVGSASDKEMWDLANYVISIGRKPVWSMNEQEVKAFYSSVEQREKDNAVLRGKYLVHTHGCGDCHSPYTKEGRIMEDLRYAGGMRWTLGPFGEVTTINLTSDKETGLGSWTDDEIKRALTKGIRKDGSRSLPFPMPWTSLASMKENDLNAIVAYLRTLPPIYNKIPEPKSLGFFSYLWGKFKMLILKKDFPLVICTENAGTTKSQPASADAAQGKEAQR